MTNKFPIEISADDKVIATIKRINDQLSRLTRPVRQLQEYTSKLAKVAGLDRLAKATRNFAGAAKNAAQHVLALAAPLTAIVGGGTIAGTVTLAERWAMLGRMIQRSAQAAGIAAGQFQGLRGTATALGLDAEGLGESFKAFQDILQGAQFGRNPEALVLLNRMGIVLHRTRNGAIDTGDAFRQLSGVISRIGDPAVQRLIARTLGMENFLPLLRKGPAGIDEYNRRVAALGGVQTDAQLRTADKLAESFGWLKVATGGLQNEIGARLGPGLTQFFDHLTNWISANRTKIGDFFGRFGDWLAKLDFDKIAARANSFLTSLGNIVDKLGGFKTILIALGGLMTANLVAPFFSLAVSLARIVPALGTLGPLLASLGAGYAVGTVVSGAIDSAIQKLTGEKDATLGTKLFDWTHPEGTAKFNPTANSQAALDFFQGKGWSAAQASGIVANFIRESGLNPDVRENWFNKGHLGVGQWDAARQADFAAWAGHPLRGSSLQEQLEFANYELTQGKYRGVGDRLRHAGTAAFAASVVGKDYEVFGDNQAELNARSDLAAQIEIHIHGAAPGTKVEARRKDGGHVPVHMRHPLATAS
ncbi:MAG TPA: phage tail tip lysozyme [Nevskia sp.]|nr:phage tail tip lysozyme [Nevskia sp.]